LIEKRKKYLGVKRRAPTIQARIRCGIEGGFIAQSPGKFRKKGACRKKRPNSEATPEPLSIIARVESKGSETLQAGDVAAKDFSEKIRSHWGGGRERSVHGFCGERTP